MGCQISNPTRPAGGGSRNPQLAFQSNAAQPNSLKETRKEETDQKMIMYRNLQNRIKSGPFVKPNYGLLICVDARAAQTGGYCVNFVEKTCNCYTITVDSNDLPWELRDKSTKGNPSEFHMKNLMFALLLWEDQIIARKEVQIHTNCPAIIPTSDNKYGKRVRDFIQHLVSCERIQVNSDLFLNGTKDPEPYARYIIPAGDLCRWRISQCEDFLSNTWRVYTFRKSHARQTQRRRLQYKNYYDETATYLEYVEKVKAGVKKWRKRPCRTCGFQIENSGSLRAFQMDL